MSNEKLIQESRNTLAAQIETLKTRLREQVGLLTPEPGQSLADADAGVCLAVSETAQEALQTLAEISHRSLLLSDLSMVDIGMSLGNLKAALEEFPGETPVAVENVEKPHLKQGFHVFQPITRHAAMSSFAAEMIRRPSCADMILTIDRCVYNGLRDWLDQRQNMCYETPVWFSEMRTPRGRPVVEVREHEGCALIVAGDNREFMR